MNNWYSFPAVTLQLHTISQFLLQNQNAKISANGTFWTVFSLKTNISDLQRLPGVQQGREGPSQMAFPRAPPQWVPTAIRTGMQVSPSWRGNPCTLRSQPSSSQRVLCCSPRVASRMCCTWPSATATTLPAHGDGGVTAGSHRVPAAPQLGGLALT